MVPLEPGQSRDSPGFSFPGPVRMAKLQSLKPRIATLSPQLRTVVAPVQTGRAWPTEQRVRGRKLQRQRATLFRREPLCAECERHDRVAVATQRDHIVPLSEGGADDASNEQGLCAECHEVKSKAEAARGVRRWAKGRGA